MDPVTAAILIGMAVSVGTAIITDNAQKKEAKRARDEQEKLRVDSVRAEIGETQQKTNLALGTAAKRPTSGMQPSFASAALTGNQSSNTSSAPTNTMGSSGTF